MQGGNYGQTIMGNQMGRTMGQDHLGRNIGQDQFSMVDQMKSMRMMNNQIGQMRQSDRMGHQMIGLYSLNKYIEIVGIRAAFNIEKIY